MFNLGRYGSRNNLNLQIFDYVTKEPLMRFDYATTTTNEWTGETVYARGGDGNPKRISWSGNKESTLAVETQIFTLQHLAMLAGEKITSGEQSILKSEVLTVEDGGSGKKQITLSRTPIGDTSKINVFAFVNGIITDSQTIQTVAGKVITLDATSNVEIGQDVEVYYQFTAGNGSKLSFTTKGFPGYVKIAGDTLFADEMAGDMIPVQEVFYKARLQPNFTLGMSPTGDPTSITLTFDIFPVKVNGIDVMADMIVYDDEEAPEPKVTARAAKTTTESVK